MLDNPSFWQIFRNTIVIATSKIVTLQFCAVVLALLLNEVRKLFYKRSVQSLVYLPYFLSWIVLGGIMLEMLGSAGVVNQLLQRAGVEQPVIFLGNNRTFVPTLVASHLWQQVGWATILYLAALTSIDPQLLEAAAIDGAGRFHGGFLSGQTATSARTSEVISSSASARCMRRSPQPSSDATVAHPKPPAAITSANAANVERSASALPR